jgi:hypothetical protein
MILVPSRDTSKNSGKSFDILFFILHYGIFTMVHGAIIVVFFSGMLNSNVLTDGENASESWNFGAGLVWAVLAILISHTVSFFMNYVGKKEYLTVSLNQVMFQPYGRVIVMHFTILAGAFLLTLLGAPIGGLIVLVILKIILDLYSHLNQHRVGKSKAKIDVLAG